VAQAPAASLNRLMASWKSIKINGQAIVLVLNFVNPNLQRNQHLEIIDA
jgi:hypothetical protein